MAKKLAIVLAKDLSMLQMSRYYKNPAYIWFAPTKTFVLKHRLKDIKELLDQHKTIAEVNEIITN